MDPADRLHPRAVRGRARCAEARRGSGDAERRVAAIAATNLDTIVGPMQVGRRQPAALRRRRTSPRRRWSAANGGSRTAANTTSSSSTTRPIAGHPGRRQDGADQLGTLA